MDKNNTRATLSGIMFLAVIMVITSVVNLVVTYGVKQDLEKVMQSLLAKSINVVDTAALPNPDATTKTPSAQPAQVTLANIKLSSQPDRTEVIRYVHQIMDLSRKQRSHFESDLQVSLLAQVGREHLDVLINAVKDGLSWSDYAVYAIKQIAIEEDKNTIIAYLKDKKKLVKVVYAKNWQTDAKEILVSAIMNSSNYFPSEWLNAIASFRDPTTYPALKSYLINGWNRHSTYKIIKDLPGIDLSKELPQAWDNSRSGREYEVAYLLTDVLAMGHLPALEYTIDMLDSNNKLPNTVVDTRQLVIRFTEARGSNNEMQKWFKKNKNRLYFHEQSKKYLVD
ncbi:hypothetical protein [Kaarinaea lacus]